MFVKTSLCRSFLAFKTFSQSFLWQNFAITHSLSLSQWQASKSFLSILQSKLRKIWHTFISASSFVKDLDNPAISTVSLLEYWAFAQHCFSVSTRRDNNSEFAFLAIATSASSLSNYSFRSLNFSKSSHFGV